MEKGTKKSILPFRIFYNSLTGMEDFRPFDSDKESWLNWKADFAIYAEAQRVTQQHILKDLLLLKGGVKLQAIYVSLPKPSSSSETAYDDCLELLDGHFASTNKLLERYKLWSIIQHVDEKFITFVDRILAQVSLCGFSKEFSAMVVSQQLIFGLRSGSTRKKLLEKERPMVEIMQICIEDEKRKKSASREVSTGSRVEKHSFPGIKARVHERLQPIRSTSQFSYKVRCSPQLIIRALVKLQNAEPQIDVQNPSFSESFCSKVFNLCGIRMEPAKQKSILRSHYGDSRFQFYLDLALKNKNFSLPSKW